MSINLVPLLLGRVDAEKNKSLFYVFCSQWFNRRFFCRFYAQLKSPKKLTFCSKKEFVHLLFVSKHPLFSTFTYSPIRLTDGRKKMTIFLLDSLSLSLSLSIFYYL